MIPYIEIPPIKLGPVEIYAFGILVMIAILIGNRVVLRRSAGYGINSELAQKAVLWVVVSGFVGAHLFDVFLYHPGSLISDPLLILKLNKGLSSFGGFLGGFAGALIFAKRSGVSFRSLMDTLCLGFVAGWPIGRMGCALAHDHPGSLSDSFFAVAYPGGARFDLGLYEMLSAVIIFFVFEQIRKRELAPGSLIPILALIYTPVRFLLDFLRTDDTRYLNLTPAQIASVLFFIAAAFLLIRLRAQGSANGKAQAHRAGKGGRKS
ncbi:MAG: prolipoprotein diacylglyceryl transferase [Proteobacteria bacterium]|nr:prolipoprotein diacylglyceryl transferase [Pseudomonadota bacterium]